MPTLPTDVARHRLVADSRFATSPARLAALVGMALALSAGALRAEDEAARAAEDGDTISATTNGDKRPASASKGEQPAAKPKYPPLSKVIKDTKRIDGMLTLHQGDTKLLAELKPGDFDRDFMVLITIARGIGQMPILGGFSWDDWIWRFRKVGDRVHVVRRNVRFRAKPGSPEAKAVKLAYTDSILFSLPIVTKSGSSCVVDLGPIFLSDLPQISQVLRGFTFSKSRSTWAEVKGYDQNVEIQVAATYASSGTQSIDTVPDTRGATVNLHYSISKLPKTSYKPRLGDDRVGYFLTVVKDFSRQARDDRFVRYINRWDLRKADPSADKSPPKEPIVFWLEKTIPFKYRKPIRDGIAEWNKAFEKAGFYDAIDVRQQPDDAEWDPGDVRYNTFRWITADAGFAMGPSRVNPVTGQILDADIIFDADFLRYWRQDYETFTPKGIEALTGGPIEPPTHADAARLHGGRHHCAGGGRCACNLLGGVGHQLAFAATMAAVRQRTKAEEERLITQALKEVTMHEVGHTLGLRHNFKGSALYNVDELNDVSKTSKTGLSASVMDYNPANIAPGGVEQGDYYSTTIGPYDYWAIEYGYKPLKDEKKGLAKIASRSGERELAYATDEDARGYDPDPHCFRYDQSSDLVAYARRQAQLIAEAWPTVVEDSTEEGEGYERARQSFGVLLGTHAHAMYVASRYVGGLHSHRGHKGDKGAPAPYVVVDAAQQRAAMDLLAEQVFSDTPFLVPAEVYSYLAPSRWWHWGTRVPPRVDYPIHRVILMWQERVLDRLLSSTTLSRLHDSELKVSADEDAFTTAELIDRLSGAIFASLDAIDGDTEYTARKPAVSSLQRNLQRAYFQRLSRLALGRSSAPQDCQTLAFAELSDLAARIDWALKSSEKLDAYTRAHLTETRARIDKVLEASMVTLP